jgi:transcriptional regulator with XRE-family HTH domain
MTAAAPSLTANAEYPFSPPTLRRLRKQRGLDVTRFAVLVGRSAFTLSAYEAGKQIPPADVVALMGAVLGVHPGDLFVAAEEEAMT